MSTGRERLREFRAISVGTATMLAMPEPLEERLLLSFPHPFELSSLLPIHGGDGTAGFVLNGVNADEGSGVDVSGAGDVNGDGFDDVVIATQFGSTLGLLAGDSYLVFGQAGGFAPELDLATLAAGGGDAVVRIWRVRDGSLKNTLKVGFESIHSIAYSHDGNSLAFGHSEVTVIDVVSSKVIVSKKIVSFLPGAMTFSPDDGVLAVVGADRPGEVVLWTMASGERIKLDGHERFVSSVALAPDEKTLATSDVIGVIHLWDAEAGELTATLFEDSMRDQAVRSVSFSPDGRYLASGSDDGVVRLWNVETARLEKSVSEELPVPCVVWSPDGKTLATLGGRIVKLWKVDSLVRSNEK